MAELAYDLTPSTDDRLFQAEGMVRSYCGWHIAPSRTDTVSVVGSGSGVLILPSLHVTAIDSVIYDGELVDDADYAFSDAGVLTRLCRGWGCRTPLVVKFAHGYEDVPPEITGVVQAIAQRAVGNPGSLVSWTRGPFSETYGPGASTLGLLVSEYAILDRYRLPPRP